MAVPQTQVAVIEVPNDYPCVHITARHGWLALDLTELCAYRELPYFFVWRDIRFDISRLYQFVNISWTELSAGVRLRADLPKLDSSPKGISRGGAGPGGAEPLSEGFTS